MDKEKLLLIDGNSLLHRAFHALPPLKTNDGVYTNGVYGFLTMLYKILEEHEPDYIAVAFDKKSPTFRHKEYDNYKAGRKETPNQLKSQFPILKEILDKMNICRIEIDGYEADDIVGTLAKFGEKKDFNVIAFTGDKDYLQLISDSTKVAITKKGISNIEIYDNKKMIERYGLDSKQFIDLKGLMGDKSDNIPGIPGIGEKTGIKLLKQYKSIDGIYQNIDNISGKMKERLIENRQQAIMSKRLVTIITNIPIDISIDSLKKEDPDSLGLYEIYRRLEFNSLLDKIDINEKEKDRFILKTDFNIIYDKEELYDVLDQVIDNGKFIFKFVVDGNDYLNDPILGVAIKCNESVSYYMEFKDNRDLFFKDKRVIDIFQDERIKKEGHNLKEDIIVLFKNDIEINGIYFDTVVGQYLINPSQNNYDIKHICTEYLNLELKSKEDILGKGKKSKTWSDLDIDKRGEFFCNIVDTVYRVETEMLKKISDYEMTELFFDVEIPLIEVLANMEYTGFKVDSNKLKELGKEFDEKIDGLKKNIYELSGEEFNINSPKQLGVILFEKLELPIIKKTKTGYSTSAEVLDKLKDKHPIIEKILEYRQIVKLKTTYVDGLLSLINNSDNRVHSSFNQTITTTGRISSTEPNLQNIPIKTEEGRKIRKVFIAEDDDFVLVDADYSQIELRVLGHISKDSKLMEAFFKSEDIHTKTASEVFGVSKDEVTSLMRSRAKAVNFGIIYGISDFGLSRDLKIPRKESKLYIDNYLKNYKKVKEYMEDIVKEGREKGFVKTILNRRRFLPEIKSKNFNVRSFGERMAMNTPIQGSAADIIKIAMVNVYKQLKCKNMKSKLILQVHDELIIEASKGEVEEVKNLLKNLMENAVELEVPLKVDMKTGDSWYETK
ncbi:DNA polymerase I [Clostridiisalibacter paucivorans]|uniref:DNA polymerase I n=1 Tax=Clostridiisalibacter paucivorans TaxID=408753 RepID=UPI00047B7082|nr:DNA polymerase I [Clostridiisalibacter paucivorans]